MRHFGLVQQRNGHRQAIEAIEKQKNFRGPCSASIEPVLQRINIQRQAYHGGAFVGNHVHRALQPAVVDALASAPLLVVSTRCPALADEAKLIKERNQALLSAYSRCTALFSHCNVMQEGDTALLEREIAAFLQLCCQHIVHRQLGHVTPKLHLLKSHVIPSIKRL